MRSRFGLTVLLIALLVFPTLAAASTSTVFETTGWITESEGLVYNFTADTAPFLYKATITDLSIDPYFGFDFLFLSISTAVDVIDFLVVDLNVGQGSFTFDAVPGTSYFANVFGTGAGQQDSGNFGLLIQGVPIPTSLMLLGSGLFGIVLLRRKMR